VATNSGRSSASRAAHGKKKPATKKQPAKRAPSAPRSTAERTSPPPSTGTSGIDLSAIALVTVAILLAIASWFHALGPVGSFVDRVLADIFGLSRFVIPLAAGAAGIIVLANHLRLNWRRFAAGGSAGLIALAALADLAKGSPKIGAPVATLAKAGGYVGAATGTSLARAIGTAGAVVVACSILITAVIVGSGAPLSVVLRSLRQWSAAAMDWVRAFFASTRFETPSGLDEVDITSPAPKATAPKTIAPEPKVLPEPAPAPTAVPDEAGAEVIAINRPAPKSKKLARPTPRGNWVLPTMDLLHRSKEHRHDERQVEEAGTQLVAALATHGVDTTLIGWTIGPTVTRYELELGPGVKVARITSLNRDIAYAMASPDVRILAPIPGRQAIGIEVPNRQRQLVALGDILASEEAAAAHHPLEVAVGRDISGRAVMVNLAEMPHILIAGATGSGKSSCMNSLITSVLMRSTPEEVEMILIDPKRVELGQYNGLPHLKTPVVVDPKKAANALNWAVKEMERRYDLLAEFGLRDITGWNEAFDRGELHSPKRPNDKARIAEARAAAHLAVHGEELHLDPAEAEEDDDAPKRMPFMLVIVDELNDLMMVAARDVEESIVRIAQMARAVGIHLVLATQRPSVNVVTGVIKANVPSRMAFSVSSLADSRVILDQSGAERLVGKGDMLLLTASSNVARRIQAPWVSEEEVRSVVAEWQRQGGTREPVIALSDLEAPRLGSTASSGGSSSGGDDELYLKARDLVVRNQTGSTSMLQRSLRVGFARAGRLMDMLEEEGVVGPSDGSKTREVLWSPEQLDAELQ